MGSDDGNLGMEGIEFESEKKDNDDNLEKSIDTEEAQQNEVNTFIENVISQSSDEGLGDEDKRLKNMKRGLCESINFFFIKYTIFTIS